MNDTLQTLRKRTAPLWPLKKFVAVNPFTGYRDLPFASAAARIAATTGASLTQPADFYRRAYESGHITADDLQCAAEDPAIREKMVALLRRNPRERATFQASFAAHAEGVALPDDTERFVVRQIALVCATHYDRNQTAWTSPWKTLPLYAAWRERLRHDRNAEAFGLPGFAKRIAALPESPEDTVKVGLERLKPAALDDETFLLREMRALAGWSGYLRHLEHEASLRGEERNELENLVAIRLACEVALLEIAGPATPAAKTWFAQPAPAAQSEDDELLALWQTAYEAGYIRGLAGSLARNKSAAAKTGALESPAVDAVFCIDVRSEPLRRHLETGLPSTRTHGFAGFFGFPVAHRDAGDADQPRCPVLLAPPLPAHSGNLGRDTAKAHGAQAWAAFQNSAASCFSFMEVGGPLAAFSLLGQRKRPDAKAPAPAWDKTISLETQAATAAGALINMGLTGPLGRIVLLCGHGALSANNPHAASLECGACGGHAGDVNARLAADTFNDPEVRKILAGRGLPIPESTRFLAALHITQTDEVKLYDTDKLPATHSGDLATLREALDRASARTRAERAIRLGVPAMDDAKLLKRLEKRGTDRSEVRPEWALAGNAALIAAPRSRTLGLDLAGRTFLQDYDHRADPDGAILRLILSAPVVVASWINLQYYASTLNPAVWGSGDKTLHQIVAGIGVVEGNGGDLRTGLPIQSVHDGKDFVHETRRLAVYIEAPRAKIDAELAACPDPEKLFANGWLHLVAIESDTAYRRLGKGVWKPV